MKRNIIIRYIQMTNNHEKMFKIFILVGIHIELRYYFTSTRTGVRKWKILNVGKNVKQ